MPREIHGWTSYDFFPTIKARLSPLVYVLPNELERHAIHQNGG
jgi:hypothetical protein